MCKLFVENVDCDNSFIKHLIVSHKISSLFSSKVIWRYDDKIKLMIIAINHFYEFFSFCFWMTQFSQKRVFNMFRNQFRVKIKRNFMCSLFLFYFNSKHSNISSYFNYVSYSSCDFFFGNRLICMQIIY